MALIITSYFTSFVVSIYSLLLNAKKKSNHVIKFGLEQNCCSIVVPLLLKRSPLLPLTLSLSLGHGAAPFLALTAPDATVNAAFFFYLKGVRAVPQGKMSHEHLQSVGRSVGTVVILE